MSRGGGGALLLAAALFFTPTARAEKSSLALTCAESDFKPVEKVIDAAYRKALREGGRWGRRAADALDAPPKARFLVATPVDGRSVLPVGVEIRESAVMECCTDHAIKINHEYLHSWSFNESVLVSSPAALGRFVDLTAGSAVHEAVHYEREARFGKVPTSLVPVEEEVLAEYAAALFTLDRARLRPSTIDEPAADARVARVLKLFDLDDRYGREFDALDRIRQPTDAERDRMTTLARWLSSFRLRRLDLQTELAAEPGRPGIFWIGVGLLARSNERFESAVRGGYPNRHRLDAMPVTPSMRAFYGERLDEARSEADRRRRSDAGLFARFANL